MRAARTDKGVSAACQVVSAKLMVEPPDLFAARVNQHLPKQVCVSSQQQNMMAQSCVTAVEWLY